MQTLLLCTHSFYCFIVQIEYLWLLSTNKREWVSIISASFNYFDVLTSSVIIKFYAYEFSLLNFALPLVFIDESPPHKQARFSYILDDSRVLVICMQCGIFNISTFNPKCMRFIPFIGKMQSKRGASRVSAKDMALLYSWYTRGEWLHQQQLWRIDSFLFSIPRPSLLCCVFFSCGRHFAAVSIRALCEYWLEN